MKIASKKSLRFMLFLVSAIILAIPMGNVKANEPKNSETITKEELLENGVAPEKVDTLLEKIEEGQTVDADLYVGKEENLVLATEENPNYKKVFPDGSFIESKIEDITDEENQNVISPRKVEQIGGTQENRTLKVSHIAVWGSQSFKVKVYFPQIGYSKINQAYGWEYFGTVSGTDYKGIYRANETATADAVAIQKLNVTVPKTGISYLTKLEFRMRDGRFWDTYTQSKIIP
ncbi:hypothetical protein ACWF5S_29970 [Peribacillus butanolivorans]